MYTRGFTLFEKPYQNQPLIKQGNLFIISGPSGVGKTSIINRLLQDLPTLERITSYTTRPMRPGEIADQTYHYIGRAEFKNKIKANDFLNYMKFSDNYYGFGLSLEQLLQKLNSGIDLIVDIDYSRVADLKSQVLSSRSIFIMPPSIDELKIRLSHRGEDAETIEKRMRYAQNMIDHATVCDKIIINETNKMEDAVNEIKNLILTTEPKPLIKLNS